MTFEEVKKSTWGFMEAIPSGRIDTKEQYNYMLEYNKQFSFGFYFTNDDRHIPTFEECKGKYLSYISFFGGASFFLTIEDSIKEWDGKRYYNTYPEFSYGKYGRLE